MLDGTTLAGSTLEILSLLAVAFLLGYLMRLFIGNKWKKLYMNNESEKFKLTDEIASYNSKIKSLEDSNSFLRAELQKAKKVKPTFSAPSVKPLTGSTGNGESAVTLSKSTATAVSSSAKPSLATTAKVSKSSKPKEAKAKAKPAVKKTTAKASPAKKSNKKDDLKKIEGIGPKIEQIFNSAGIKSYDDLASSTPTKLKKILLEAGSRYKMHDPKTWPRQAKLASSGNWKRLKTLQDSLKGGKVV
ncbi:MAG: helix-hairpin-helix domain-containing protein [Bacteroidota bacterium]